MFMVISGVGGTIKNLTGDHLREDLSITTLTSQSLNAWLNKDEGLCSGCCF